MSPDGALHVAAPHLSWFSQSTPFAAQFPQFRTQRSSFSIPMSIWFLQAIPEALNDLSAGTMVEHLGIEFVEVGEDSLTARMPVDQRTIQPAGLLHGGASVALAETLGSVAATPVRRPGRHRVRRPRDQRQPHSLGAIGLRHRRGAADPPRLVDTGVGYPHHRRAGPPDLHLPADDGGIEACRLNDRS